jgi:acetylglutamate kinase
MANHHPLPPPPTSPNIAALLEALPYIREFRDKPIVIKYGGAAMSDGSLREGFAQEVALLKYVGMNPIVVHGGGSEITHYTEKFGLKTSFVDGLRVTDAETMKIVKMVLVGKINKDIVDCINRHDQTALGLCGEDGKLFQTSKRWVAGRDIGFVGQIDHVDTELLSTIARSYVAVIAPVGCDDQGQSYNVNADEAAGAIAQAMTASKVVFLTDVAGWLSDPKDPHSLIRRTNVAEVEAALATNSIDGGMRPKLQACVDAIKGGAESAHIIDGRVPNSLLLEVFTHSGIGTKIFA